MKIRQKRLLKKLISISISLLVIISLTVPMCISSSAAENTTDFLGGDGTAEHPYLISNRHHFNNIRDYADDKAYFKMIADVQFASWNFGTNGDHYNNGSLWLPIKKFNGKFDGAGYTLSGIQTKEAIFDVITGKIENLNIKKLKSSKSSICVENKGTITNCDISGTITDDYVTATAGITITNNGEISNCNVSANVYSEVDVAGICLENNGIITYSNKSGDTKVINYDSHEDDYDPASGISNINNGIISYCSNVSAVVGGFYTAGITIENNGLISDCYNSANIESEDAWYGVDGGGIAVKNNGNIINCYNSGKCIGGGMTYGAIVKENNKQIKNCYYIEKQYADEGTGIECTDVQMQKEETFKGFDFGGVWKIDTSSDYKYPQLITTKATVESIEIVDGSPDEFKSKMGLYADISALSLKVNYSDGTERVMKGSPFMLKKFDINKLGVQKAPLYFGGKLTDEQITINVLEKEMLSISVTKKPKSDYVQGQSINLANGILTVYYDDGSSEEVSLTMANVIYDKTLVGIVPVKVGYMGFTTEFNIKVNERVVVIMSLTEPDKVVYKKGEQLDLTNGRLSVLFKSTDNYSEAVPLTPEMISGYDPYKVGLQTVTVKYLNKSASFIVRVFADMGDVNCDGKVNVVDATEIQKYIVNKDAISQVGLAVADVNGDGNINVSDATLIQKYVVGFVDSLG